MREFCHQTIRALAEQRLICRSPEVAAVNVLNDLLAESSQTAFAQEHALEHVRTLSDWKRAVPIRTYPQLRDYIDRQLQGEPRVLTRDDPYAFLKTSGTSGQAKLVPTTRHWRQVYRGPALYAQWGLYFKLLRLEDPKVENVLDLSWERCAPTKFSNGFPIYSITQRPESLHGADWTPPWYDSSWFTTNPEVDDFRERLYHLLRLRAGCDVRLIVSVNPSKIVALATALRDFGPRLVHDLRSEPVGRRLDRLLDKQGGELLLTDLWPNLSFVVCWNSASAQLYGSLIDHLLPDVVRVPFSTTGTEGIVTLPVDTHWSAGPLAVNQGVYEFVPVADLLDEIVPAANADTLSFNELETGRYYRLVMSQANGLYRYDVGDIYRVTGWVGSVPRLEFAGRGGAFSSFTGEKLTESDVFAAVSRVLQSDRASGVNFSCFPVWGEPPHYVVAIEWSSRLGAQQAAELAGRIDAALSMINPEYAEKRASGRLKSTSVIRLADGAFEKITQKRISAGVSPAQIKHQWLQRDASMLKLFDETGTRLVDLETPATQAIVSEEA